MGKKGGKMPARYDLDRGFVSNYQCRFCNKEMYVFKKKGNTQTLACHGYIILDGKRSKCPNNVD